jgi:hypothetical protein
MLGDPVVRADRPTLAVVLPWRSFSLGFCWRVLLVLLEFDVVVVLLEFDVHDSALHGPFR